ncbi:MAG: HAD family hydrolase [Chitinophagaceae bacterium]|nr:MAG: HAD family hydrolase [Chitinophagaceae bacterium]
MDIKINKNTFFVFDLDDTLYQEIDFLRSAYKIIASSLEPNIKVSIYDEMIERYHRKENVFAWIVQQYKEHLGEKDAAWLISTYREHIPEIRLSTETAAFIREVRDRKIPTGLITDGRSVTQRNKLRALGIEDLFTEIIISEEFGSEKPDERNYLHFVSKFPGSEFYYFGDNTKKDFITPARLGWTTICVKDSGKNIHKQVFDGNEIPRFVVGGFDELTLI